MLILAKDLSLKEPKHCAENRDSEIKEYMEYQRKLFPYTIVRAGLDLAYKELDDILNFVDNDHQPPADSNRQEYPADIPGWYRTRFPWASAFMDMEDLHSMLVVLIKAMDSFRTRERMNTYHLMVLYDAVHSIVELYNHLLKDTPDRARDIRLSQDMPVDFDDFINNYWPHVDFMILSQPDYAHERHLERKKKIEQEIQQRMADGEEPIKALEGSAGTFNLDASSLHLLRRDPVLPELLALESVPLNENPFSQMNEEMREDPRLGPMPLVDAEYLANLNHRKNSGSVFSND